MLPSLYSDVRPLGRLLRRMLADGCPIAEVPAEIDRMVARGEIELAGTQRLPSEWWLVQLASGRLSIETSDPDRPLDPNHFLYRERHPPPPVPIVIQSAGLIARRAREKRVAPVARPSIGEWIIELLARRLKRDQARGAARTKPFYRELFLQVFDLSERKFDGVVWPAAVKTPGVKPPSAGRPKKKK